MLDIIILIILITVTFMQGNRVLSNKGWNLKELNFPLLTFIKDAKETSFTANDLTDTLVTDSQGNRIAFSPLVYPSLKKVSTLNSGKSISDIPSENYGFIDFLAPYSYANYGDMRGVKLATFSRNKNDFEAFKLDKEVYLLFFISEETYARTAAIEQNERITLFPIPWETNNVSVMIPLKNIVKAEPRYISDEESDISGVIDAEIDAPVKKLNLEK